MNPAARFPLVAFSATLVAIVAFGVARQDLTLVLLAAIPAAASWMLTEGPRRRGLPRWLTTVLVLGVLAWTITQSPLHTDPLALAGAVGNFVLWTTVIKLYERKTTRDRRQLLGLSLVLMLSGCLSSAHLIFGALLVIYTVLMVAALMLYRLERGGEQAVERYRAVSGSAAPAAVFGGRAGRHLRRVIVRGLVVGTLVSILLFVLFPRDIMQRLEGWGAAARVAGFRSDVDLRTNARIAMSRREVMRVQWLDPSGAPTNATEPIHLRGAVLDRYDASQSRWTSSRDARAARPIPASGDDDFEPLARPPLDLRQQTFTQIVELRLLATDVIFSAWAPVAIAYPGVGTLLLSGDTLELRDPEWERGPRVWSYRIKVQPFVSRDGLMALAGAPQPWSLPRFPVAGVAEEARRVLAQVGERMPETARLEEDPEFRWSWARQASGTFMRYLQGSGFRYSTDLSGLVLRRGEDPIEAFLRRSRNGHCELFASALCGMLQSVGVEARVVVGFVAVEYEPSSSTYVIRENNAHAWVEVRTGDWTWTSVDPTPATTLESLADAGRSWTDPLRWVYDGIDFIWRTRVVSFDSNAQSSILRGSGERLSEWFRRGWSTVGDWFETLSRQFEAGGIGRVWATSVVVALVGAGAVIVLMSRRERRMRRLLRLDEVAGVERRRIRRDARFFADALLLLESAGASKPTWRPPLLHAEHLESLDRGAGEAFGALTNLYYEIRFGGAEPARSTQTDAAALLRRFEAALRRASRR